MRKTLVKLLAFVLAFVLGYAAALIPGPGDNSFPIAEPMEVETGDIPTFKYGCADAASVSFWEKLDKEQFVRQQKAQLLRNSGKEYFDKDFESFKEGFGCSYFTDVSRVDLNGDGLDEIQVQGEGGMRDWPTYIFRETDSGLRMILAEGWSFAETESGTGDRGFRNLAFTTNYTGRYREITHYRFIGKSYVATKCFSEDEYVRRNGDMIPLEKPMRKSISCRDRSRVQP